MQKVLIPIVTFVLGLGVAMWTAQPRPAEQPAAPPNRVSLLCRAPSGARISPGRTRSSGVGQKTSARCRAMKSGRTAPARAYSPRARTACSCSSVANCRRWTHRGLSSFRQWDRASPSRWLDCGAMRRSPRCPAPEARTRMFASGSRPGRAKTTSSASRDRPIGCWVLTEVGELHRHCGRRRQHCGDVVSVGQAPPPTASVYISPDHPEKTSASSTTTCRLFTSSPTTERRSCRQLARRNRRAPTYPLQPPDVHGLVTRRGPSTCRTANRYARRQVRQGRQVRDGLGHQGHAAK